MAGGLFGKPFALNPKCMVFSVIIMAIFLFKPTFKSNITLGVSLFLIFVISLNISSQSIVDIENLRHSGEIGYFKSLGLSVNGSRGNEDRDDYKLDFSVARNNEDIESFFTINNSKRTKNNVIEDKSSFFHGRVLLKSESFYSYEFYIQGSKNPFQSYRKRDLAGAGIRINAKNKYKVGLSFLQDLR